MSETTPPKPYLLRALYEWCVDNGYTPYLSVLVDGSTRVPMEYVRDGEIVLNIGPLATSRIVIGNDSIECTARFAGVARELFIPLTQVAAIYARENGQGMSFETGAVAGVVESESQERILDSTQEPDRPAPAPKGRKPTLRRVK